MDIGNPVVKIDHAPKITGRALYLSDHQAQGVLFGKLLRGTLPKARIVSVSVPDLPDGYFYVDKNDVPGANQVHMVLDDTPVFAEGTVEYIGDPIGMLVGPDEGEAARLLSQIKVEYEELNPVLCFDEATEVFFEYGYEKGNVEKAFEEADKVYKEVFRTGRQEQAYLETNAFTGEYKDGKVIVTGSMQCPFYVHRAVAKAMDVDEKNISARAAVTGGGFGGKEDYPSVLACQVAVAAKKAGKPVRVVFDRREDMEATSKRHPSKSTYKVAVKNGRVTAMDIEALYDAGGYSTLSSVVLQRGIICANGIYNIENLRVKGRALKTNTVPNGAFRGFGGPQTFFSAEMMMMHIARDLGRDTVEFRLEHAAKQGDATSTSGKYHDAVPIPDMVAQVKKACDFDNKRKLYKSQNGRFRRGIGMSMAFHGAGFTGAGERDYIKAVAKLRKDTAGNVEILTACTDIGQGLKTALLKIVSRELDLPFDRIVISDPDTARVPDSGPTVASRSVMVVGELLRRAAIQLRSIWKDGEEQTVEEHFKEPDFVIPFSMETFKGDAYPVFSWAVNAIELEIDTLTGVHKVLGAWGSFDVGEVIDANILAGQMEGGLLQSIGYASMEQIPADGAGRIRNNSFSDYIIPTSVDVPNLHVMFCNAHYRPGPYGAKGAGELPCVAGAPAYLEAVESALGTNLNHIPFTAGDSLKILREVKR